WPEFAPVVQTQAPRLENPEPPSTPVIVNPSMTTLSARIWNAPFGAPTTDSKVEDRPHPETPTCAPRRVMLFDTTTTSGYVPASTRTVSPPLAAFTAPWIVGKSKSLTPSLPMSRCAGPAPGSKSYVVATAPTPIVKESTFPTKLSHAPAPYPAAIRTPPAPSSRFVIRAPGCAAPSLAIVVSGRPKAPGLPSHQ